jgi:hypothetical protein
VVVQRQQPERHSDKEVLAEGLAELVGFRESAVPKAGHHLVRIENVVAQPDEPPRVRTHSSGNEKQKRSSHTPLLLDKSNASPRRITYPSGVIAFSKQKLLKISETSFGADSNPHLVVASQAIALIESPVFEHLPSHTH